MTLPNRGEKSKFVLMTKMNKSYTEICEFTQAKGVVLTGSEDTNQNHSTSEKLI